MSQISSSPDDPDKNQAAGAKRVGTAGAGSSPARQPLYALLWMALGLWCLGVALTGIGAAAIVAIPWDLAAGLPPWPQLLARGTLLLLGGMVGVLFLWAGYQSARIAVRYLRPPAA